MSNYSKLKVFEPLEEIKNNLYWKVYVEERDAQAKLNEPEKVVVKKIIEKSGIKVKVIDVRPQQEKVETPEASLSSVQLETEVEENARNYITERYPNGLIFIPEACYFKRGKQFYVAPWSSHILEGRNEVPIEWFMLFKDEHRHFLPQSYAEWSWFSLLYERNLGEALRDLQTKIFVLEACLPLTEELFTRGKQLHQYLAKFSSNSILILDYSDVAEFFSDEELENDHSSDDMEKAIKCLMINDIPGYFKNLARVIERTQGSINKFSEFCGQIKRLFSEAGFEVSSPVETEDYRKTKDSKD